MCGMVCNRFGSQLTILCSFKGESDDGIGEVDERSNRKRGPRKAKPQRRKELDGGDDHSREIDAEVVIFIDQYSITI